MVIHSPTPARSRVEQVLLKSVAEAVQARLKQSLHKAVHINLGKEIQPQQISWLWDGDVKVGENPTELIPEDITILDIFDRKDIAGRLLILGQPGVGKTTTLLDLAEALLNRCQKDADNPIPIIFNLSSWQDQSMQDWLIDELNVKYGVRKDIGAELIETDRIVPLLDDLDELPAHRIEPCVQAINQMMVDNNRLPYWVVCSRIETYERLESQLRLNACVYLKELTDKLMFIQAAI